MKVWPALRGRTSLEQMEDKNYWGNWLTHVHLEKCH